MALGNIAKAGTIGLAALPAVSGTLPSGVALDPAVSVFVDVGTLSP